jgi:25S rRNA (uracil2843-N3)-methyltransferase
MIEPQLDIQPAPDAEPPMKVMCFGGGAAEVVAFGGFLRYLQDALCRQSSVEDGLAASIRPVELSLPGNDPEHNQTRDFASEHGLSVLENSTRIDLLLVDTAQWQNVVYKLHESITTPPPLSKYASSSAKEANEALVASAEFNATFRQADVLEMSESQLVDAVGRRPLLLTLLFTLNELYTSSIGKTTAFLLNLTAASTSGSLLLVVDSPGSYSEAAIGTEAKKYPMHWLLDHTLLETQKSRGKESPAEWVKLVSEDSKWFRLPERLRYAIPLENMRYQMHLYRRV